MSAHKDKESPKPTSKMDSGDSRPSTPASGRVKSSTETNDRRSKHAPVPASASSGLFSFRTLLILLSIILALTLTPLKSIIMEPFMGESSSSTHSNSSPASQSGRHGNSASPKVSFGVPLSKPSSAPSPLRGQYQQQGERRQRSKRRDREDHQHHGRSPFEGFFQQDDSTETDQAEPDDNGLACQGYFCVDTGACVDRPVDCPCPYKLDTKCVQSDWYTCFRGDHLCR